LASPSINAELQIEPDAKTFVSQVPGLRQWRSAETLWVLAK
jgi:hypothetical protein